MRNKRLLIALIVLLLALGGIGLLLHRGKPGRGDVRRDKVVFALSYDPSSAPIFVAREKGFFRDEGIDASFLMHTTGKAALHSMENGNAQFATVADTVLMFAAMDGKNIRCIASIADTSKHHRVIGLKSAGIVKAADLRGKRIGVPLRTTGEFFLYTFLLFRGISLREVAAVDMQPEQMLAALERRQVDAVVTWYPTVSLVMKKLGGRATEFSDENYLMSWNLVAGRDLVRAKPDLIERILSAMLRAERFLEREPGEAVAITGRLSGSDPEALKTDWANYRFGLRLSEALLINLEDQARWALKVYYRGRKTIPDFTDYIYAGGLLALDPSAVGIRGAQAP